MAVVETTYKPTPATALDSSSNGVHPLFEFFNAAKVRDESLLKGAVRELPAMLVSWRKVLPKERMVDVTSSVELQRGLQRDAFLWSSGPEEGGLCRVQTVHIGLVVFGVVEFHDLLRDVRFEGLHA